MTVGWTPTQYGTGAKAEVIELKRQLEASGLFRVTLRSAEWPQYQQLARAGAYDLFQAGWIPDYPDADDYLAPFVAANGAFQNGYRSAAASKLLRAGNHRAERAASATTWSASCRECWPARFR